jgi:phosphoglycolate phosphatase-like HAD superfamily hydrolase
MIPAILFDVDGTLANNQHRVHHVHRKPKDWKSFFMGIPGDVPIQPVVKVAHELLQRGHKLIYVTARPQWTKDMTEQWMQEHSLDWYFKGCSYYRPDGDFRPDPLVKKELLGKIRADGYDPWLVFDDRDGVVQMWRSEGLTCFQVANGGF